MFDGVVLLHRPPYAFAGVVPELGEGILRYEYFEATVMLVLSTWGGRGEEVERFGHVWQSRLAELL